MSNYIKIPMEDGTGLTTVALAASTITGGGTITGYTARNGVTVYTATGEGTGAIVDITMGDRGVDVTSGVLLDGTNYTDDFVDSAATEAGLLSPGGAEFTITADGAGNLTIDSITSAGTLYSVGGSLKIDVPTSGGGINQTGVAGIITLTPALVDSDLETAVLGDLVFTVANTGPVLHGGSGYANGDEIYFDIATPSGTEISWDALIDIEIAGLTNYTDGPYTLVATDNMLCGPKEVKSDFAHIFYKEAQVGATGPKTCTILFRVPDSAGGVSSEQGEIISQDLNNAILKANQAENSQPTVVWPDGVEAYALAYHNS